MSHRLTVLSAKYSTEIIAASERFGDHEGVNQGRILKWISQFTNRDLPLAITVLEKINYYDAAAIRAKTKQLVKMAIAEFKDIPLNKLFFVPVEANGPGGGAGQIARVLKSIQEVRPSQVKTMLDFATMNTPSKAVVFFDDFSGTGKSLAEWWPVVEPIVRPKDVAVAFGLITITTKARSRLQELVAQILAVDDLTEQHNVLSEANTDFATAQKKRLLDYCRKTRCHQDFRMGFNDSGLLLAFKHGCPNNSLPILWWQNGNHWTPLFQRRSL